MTSARLALRVIVLLCAFGASAAAATTGALVDRSGRPVAGATIRALPFETEDAARRRVAAAAAEPEPLATAISDARGRFALDVDAAYFRVAVDAKGFAPLMDRAERDEFVGALLLEPADVVTVRLVGDGESVAGAFVRVGARDGRSDQDGVVELSFVKGRGGSMWVAHPEWAPLSKTFRRATDVPKTISMNRGIAVRGAVETLAGDPVAGATIDVDGVPAAMSGDDGTFVVAHAPAGWRELTARRGDRIGLATRRFGAEGYRLRLAEGASITGSVLDAKTQTPLAGVPVTAVDDRLGAPLASSFLSEQPDALTDAKGRFRIGPVAAGIHRVSASRIGYELGPVLAEVRAGERAEKTLGGQRLARISGTVVDEERKPIGAAAVGVAEDSRRQMAAFGGFPSAMPSSVAIARPFWSASDGGWVVREAPVDREAILEAVRSGFPHGKTDAMKLAPGERKEKVVIVIPRGITVEGRVRALGGEPIANAAIEAQPREPGSRPGMRPPRSDSSAVIETVTTAADGAFSMQLARGMYDITADAEGFALKTIRAVEVQGDVEPVTLELEQGVSVTGRVVRADGSGVADVFISASSAKQSTPTAADGGFTIADLPPGPVQLMAFKLLDYVRQPLTVEAPASNVEIRLPAAGTIRGRVLEKGSKTPVTDFRAAPAAEQRGSQRSMLPSIFHSFHSDDGSFEIPNVPTGPIEVVAEATGYLPEAASATVEEGKTTDVTILLERGTRVFGRVTAPDGTPLPEASVSVVASETNPLPGMFSRSGQARTDYNGEYAISAVAPGERSFRVTHRSYPLLLKDAEVSGREARLDLQFERGVELAGTVVREGGVPVSGAQVAASSPAERNVNRGALTDANGGFRIEGLGPGRYTVTVRAGGMTKTLRDVDVATAGAMLIELSAGGTLAGRVTGLPPGDLSTANVSVSSNDGSLSAPVRTDGTFRLEGAPPGTTRVVATAGAITAQRRSPAKIVEVTAGSETYVDLDFGSTGRVSGRVLRGGAPLEAAHVSFQMGGGALASTGSALTNAQGEYVVEGLTDGTYSVLVRDTRTGGSYRTSYAVAGSGAFDIEMPLASLRGRVIDGDTQEGIAGVSVALDRNPPPTFRVASIQTDASGSFRFEGLEAGNFMVRTSRRGYGPAVLDVVLAKDSAEEVEIRLSRADGIAIRAVDARDGRSLRAYVSVADATGRMILEQTLGGSDDTLSLAAGSFRAAVVVQGYATQVVAIVSPGGPYTVALTPGGALRIESSSTERVRARILDSSGQLLVMTRITPLPDMMIDPTGATIRGIRPGTYRLEIFDAGGGIASGVPFTIVEGQTVTVGI